MSPTCKIQVELVYTFSLQSRKIYICNYIYAAAKSLQSCPTLCNPIDGSPLGSPSPWNSPGKNTGVGCHFFLQCMKVKSESEVTQSCPTPSNPLDCSLPGSSVHGMCQARVLEWGMYLLGESIFRRARKKLRKQNFLYFK